MCPPRRPSRGPDLGPVPPRGDAAVRCPAGPPPSPLVMGAGTTADPPEGKTPACCCSCSPPLWTGRHRCPPPNTLGCPSWWRLQQCRTPLCPLHDLHAGALCSSHKVCMGRRGCPTLLPPARCALFCGGEGGRDSACCPVTALGGGSCSARVADVAAAAPRSRPLGDGSQSTSPVPPLEWSPTAASAPGAPPPDRLGWGSTEAP